ncbi:hypothetical protein RclHR1_19380006 [Rhizophagus clarus]|uniref:Uncharacterized protein n=1 Tax=Rhizophagus clarus TaxID=94130 RepID=A0A2Z6QTS1_9GLOM|nr:hypothetical protein RclHR1_19380006 [Rhizophagus clarus]GES88101.1 hypothetical protein GLOIN_2v1789983 [Rhizophagus clarus]
MNANDDNDLNEIKEIQNYWINIVILRGELMSAEVFILINYDNNYGEEEITEEIAKMVKSNEMDLAEIILHPKTSTSETLASLDKYKV